MNRIRPMTVADVPLGMRLKAQAGWNQTEADWQRFLYLQPNGCFVAELDGVAVGTTTTCGFGRVWWIAMVLVDEAVRGRGVGTALMRHALAFLDEQGATSVRLDATPLGQPLYESLGFVPEHLLARYEGTLPQADGLPCDAEPVRKDELGEVIQLDIGTLVADRSKFLIRLYEEAPESFRLVRAHGLVAGFLASRPGANALQIGPCLGTFRAGELLLVDFFRRHAGQRVFIDVPTENQRAVAFVEGMGLTVQRHLLRMCRGLLVREPIQALWASSGPELG
jgi:ribosomal protein S18 acetylase RimI-like enzyme